MSTVTAGSQMWREARSLGETMVVRRSSVILALSPKSNGGRDDFWEARGRLLETGAVLSFFVAD